jgi:hypothetical protein
VLKKIIFMGKQDVNTLVVQKGIYNTPSNIRGNYSDGFFTFNELYEIRIVYISRLFNEWALNKEVNDFGKISHEPKYNIHKSLRFNDNTLCFGGSSFVVMAMLPKGKLSFICEKKDWDLFKVPEKPKAEYRLEEEDFNNFLDILKSL